MEAKSRKRKHEKSVPKNKDKNKETQSQSNDKAAPLITWKKIGARVLLTFLLMATVYFTQRDKNFPNEVVFVGYSEKIDRRSHRTNCSNDYEKEKHLIACLPKICGRVVTDTLISEEEAKSLRKIAEKGLSLGGSDGGASILDLHSGALSSGRDFINIYKLGNSAKAFTKEDFNLYRIVKNRIHRMVSMEFGAMPNDLHLTHPTFFSKITSKPAKTIHDEYWHPHIDKETYQSFHYTTLLYLNDYGNDFSGGQFVFLDKHFNMTVQPRTGRLSMFTSGSENPHRVEIVTSGVRYALTISFTCNKKYAITDVGPKH